MKIKIIPENAGKIEAELNKVNGKSTAHTLCSYNELVKVVEGAEKTLLQKVEYKKYMKGCSFSHISGGCVAKAYKYPRNCTCIQVVWGADGSAFLTEVDRSSDTGNGLTTLHLSTEAWRQANTVATAGLTGITVDRIFTCRICEKVVRAETPDIKDRGCCDECLCKAIELYEQTMNL